MQGMSLPVETPKVNAYRLIYGNPEGRRFYDILSEPHVEVVTVLYTKEEEELIDPIVQRAPMFLILYSEDDVWRVHSTIGKTVLDPFCHTANLGKECAKIGRKYVGFVQDRNLITEINKELKEAYGC